MVTTLGFLVGLSKVFVGFMCLNFNSVISNGSVRKGIWGISHLTDGNSELCLCIISRTLAILYLHRHCKFHKCQFHKEAVEAEAEFHKCQADSEADSEAEVEEFEAEAKDGIF
ncbi:hypothetical protein Q3G72_027374 [Acer saccharum]|nr:hypothetical protein Q3G72_027374 [Acer saccharum]